MMAATEGCHSAGGAEASCRSPWQGKPRAADKDRLYQYVRSMPDGAPIRKVVSDVFGDGVDPGDADYQLARRFYNRYPEFFKTDSRGVLTWVEPRIGLYQRLNLRQQYAKGKTSVGDGDGDKPAESLEGEPAYAKDRASAFLEKYLQIQSDKVKQSLFESLVRDVEGTEDLWQIMKDVDRGVYHGIPYRTRHNDGGRAMNVKEGFGYALEDATRRHNRAVVLTVTTDPKQHSGLSEALQNLSENKNRLMSWLSTEYQLGYRPENLCALEFTESGLPHYHIVLFGVSWAVSQGQLAAKWAEYGQGYVVDVRQAKNRHDSDTWVLHDDEQGKVSLSWYLGKAIRELVDLAEADSADLRDRLQGGDLSLWRQSLYWATDRRYYSCSPSLRRPTAGDSGDSATTWVFVGVAEYNQIPGHVRDNMRFHTRPPPD